MKKIIYISVLILSAIFYVFAQDPPSFTDRIYWPGIWQSTENSGRFKLGYWHPDTFSVNWIVYSSYPAIGYPYYSGNTVGINDTAKVRVYFDNRTASDFPVASANPDEWFIPELYDPNVDVFTASPIADTSVFDYRFEHWITMHNDEITSKPDTLYTPATLALRRGTRYGMVISIWGVYPGKYRVILKPTVSKPANIVLVLNSPYNCFTFSKAQHLLDTLNSYSNNAYNALLRHQYTLFDSFGDSIFDINSRSVTGWALEYHGHAAQADTTSALKALDSLLNILENSLDTLIADSSEQSEIEKAWLQQWGVDYRYYQGCMLYPDNYRWPPF